ncbi:metallophosphatase, partial [Flavonifractor plautii]
QAEWHGGRVRTIRPSVLMLERGQVFDLGGRMFFVMGGASSHDIQDGILEPDAPDFLRRFQQLNAQGAAFRVNHRSWWREELPNEVEYAEARASLDQVGWTVDYLLTHCAPTSIQNDLLGPLSKPDALTDFLEGISQRCRFKYHFFGHYHENEIIREKYVLLYEQIIRLK